MKGLKLRRSSEQFPLARGRARGPGGEGPAALLLAGILAAACAPAPPPSAAPDGALAAPTPEMRILDDFETVEAWEAHPSEGVELRIGQDEGYRGGRALRLDFDFRGGGGWAAARRELSLRLPENYELSFWLRGEAPLNTLEFKLIDPSGENVWWIRRPDFEFQGDWRKVTFRRRHVEFAWGPARERGLEQLGALEFTITAGTGGAGTLWIDELALTPLEPVRPYDLTPTLRASSTARGSAPERVLEGDTTTAWRSARDGAEWLALDFLRNREYGGLVIDWDPQDRATQYEVQVSPDGAAWQTVYRVEDGRGSRDYIFIPETESRHLRLSLERSGRGQGYALRRLEVQPLEWAASRNDLFFHVARDAPRGSYPKYLDRVQSYWTVVGVSGDEKEALVNEEGMVEVEQGSFSLEPFLYTEGRLVTWHDVRRTQSLEQGYLPIPTVQWDAGELALTVTAWAGGARGASTLFVRYRLENRGTRRADPTLYVALRPFQVNPPWQFLNLVGGAANVREIAYDGQVVTVQRAPARPGAASGETRVIPITPPAGFGASTFHHGSTPEFLREGRLPERRQVSDDFGAASAALAYPFSFAPGETREVYLAIPLHPGSPRVAANQGEFEARNLTHESFTAALRTWEEQLGRVVIDLPPAAEHIAQTLKSNLAYILINRDGPAIQPGSRAYQRSWIRDGSLTSAALLRLGHPGPVREFIEWYAPFQFPSGHVPCCVDRRGADPVPEHDSHGQLIYLIAEYHRHTGDRAFVERMWPHVARAVEYIDTLRHQRMTEVYRSGDSIAYYGLVPQSISHEGYAERPMHSFWDQLFVLKGLKDATELAAALGRETERRRFAAMRDEFRRDLMQSYRRTMAMHGIDYLPGAVELGDFDPASTTVGVAPVGEQHNLPQPALQRTFDRYWTHFVARREGRLEGEAYTPYELRVVGTFVRLGQKQRAHEALDFFFRDRRPAGWNHWAEVVFRAPAHPGFIGDMPHTWVGSDYIRSVTDIFAYERDADQALVVGAGVLEPWVMAQGGVLVRNLPTYYGTLTYAMQGDGQDVWIDLEGELRRPPGGIIIRSPRDRPIRQVLLDGRPYRQFSPTEVRLDRWRGEVVLRY